MTTTAKARGVKVGDSVRPNTIGRGPNGETYDWSHLVGRVEAVWTSPGTAGEPVAAVRWTRGVYFGHGRTDGFPLSMLVRA